MSTIPKEKSDALAALFAPGFVDDVIAQTIYDIMTAGLQPFVREERYFVLKHKDVAALPEYAQTVIKQKLRDITVELAVFDTPRRKYVVVESDWPEYEATWEAIERRMTEGK